VRWKKTLNCVELRSTHQRGKKRPGRKSSEPVYTEKMQNVYTFLREHNKLVEIKKHGEQKGVFSCTINAQMKKKKKN